MSIPKRFRQIVYLIHNFTEFILQQFKKLAKLRGWAQFFHVFLYWGSMKAEKNTSGLRYEVPLSENLSAFVGG